VNVTDMRVNYFILVLVLCAAQFPFAQAQTPANPTADQLMQIMRLQPAVDVSAPVTATADFDPPLVRPGEKSIYRVIFSATEVSVRLPEPILAPASLTLRRSLSGQNMQPAGGAMRIFSTFNYDARATEPGVFTVPEFTAEVYGKTVAVPAAQLEVKADLPEPHETVRQLLIETPATNVFVGETFNVSVRLPATAPNGVEGVSQIQINGDGFIEDKNAVRQTIQTIEKNGRKVPTFIYETSVTPISAGRLDLSAQGFTSGMQFSGPVIITGQVSFSDGAPKYLLLEAEPFTINVRPLPAGSELPGYTGAVGSYTCDLPSLATNTFKAGEPVQLNVIIRGQKNLGRINPPPPPRAPGWQIFPAERGGIAAGTGTSNAGAIFKYTLIPLTDAVRATPAIPFSCFDPARGKYVDLTIPSLPVIVLPGETQTNADAALMLSENESEPEQKSGLSKPAQAPGWTAGSLLPLQMRGWFPLVQIVPAVGFCGLWFWDRRRRHLEQHPEIVRRRQARRALRRELRLLEQAAVSADAAGFIRCVINSLQIVSAPHYPAAPRALVCGDVLQILNVSEREGTSGETVRRFFSAADAAAFARDAGTKNELLAEKSAVKEILAKLEARL
jgi:hypothetical protein